MDINLDGVEATHPPTDEELEAMEADMGLGLDEGACHCVHSATGLCTGDGVCVEPHPTIPPTLWEAPVTVRAGRYLDSLRGSERTRMAALPEPKSAPALAVHAAEAVMRAPRLHATGDLDGVHQQHARATELACAGLEAARQGTAAEAFLKALLVDLEAPCAEVCGHQVCKGWLSCQYAIDNDAFHW